MHDSPSPAPGAAHAGRVAAGPWLTRPVVAWALYDVASSAYPALVATYFGLYFVKVVAADRPQAATWWGLLAALTLVVAGLLAPFVGALADQRNRRLGILAAATVACCAATIAMAFTARGGPWLAAILFVVAQVGYTLATAIYDSLLVAVARPPHLNRVSGFGWAVGLMGGIAALCIAILVMRDAPVGNQPAVLGQVFMLSGVFMVVIALPAIAAMRSFLDRSAAGSSSRAARAPFAAVVGTLRSWRHHRAALRLLGGYYLINDTLVTLTFFIAIVFQARYGLDLQGLLWLSLLFHVVAIPSTWLFGHLADRWQVRGTVHLQIAILCAALVLLAVGSGGYLPVVIVVLLGLVFGSLQALCRSWFALLTPAERAAEFFGFNAVAGRLSAALGPLTFSAVAALTGSQQAAVLSLILFLVLGGVALRGVPTDASGSRNGH